MHQHQVSFTCVATERRVMSGPGATAASASAGQVGGQEVHRADLQPGGRRAAAGRQVWRRLQLLGGGGAEGRRAEAGSPVHAAGCGRTLHS